MDTNLLQTKLNIPPTRTSLVPRQRLIEKLNGGLDGKLILVSASAGFGKTTLVSKWVNEKKDERGRMRDETRPQLTFQVAWLSLDEGDSDPTRFLAYLVAALQTVVPTIGGSALGLLQSPQPPSPELVLTMLLNEITAVSTPILLILDDYHLIDAPPIDHALTFLLDHLPPQMRMLITTREDPPLPLARMRVRRQLTELRAAELRFTPDEAAQFLNQMMGLNLSTENIAALETRTEGWIAGLQLAALALQGQMATKGEPSATQFIQSFTGSHRFVLDYLAEEVLQQQPDTVQTFLLHTAILDRLSGSLCDAVLSNGTASGQEMLAYLEQANLFIVPLDNERRWYRYHRLFADLLRQRLQQEDVSLNLLHSRASHWFEAQGQDIEAFQHAAAANDIERATRLVEGAGMPLIFRGGAVPVLNWLASLPTTVLDATPSLWAIYGSAKLFANQIAGVEEKLVAAEAALAGIPLDETHKDIIGHIAAIRAAVAVVQNDLETIIVQSHRALAHLHPDNLPVRTATTWTLGAAYQLQGDRAAASRAYTDALASSQAIGHYIITIMTTLGLGNLQESATQLRQAAETYRHALQLIGDPPQPLASEAYLGLARIHYEWDDLESAQTYGEQSVQLARLVENNDRFIASDLFLVRLKLAQGDVAGAAALLAEVERAVYAHDFRQQAALTAVKVTLLLRQKNVSAAAHWVETHNLPMSRARVLLAKGETAVCLTILATLRQNLEAKGWVEETLRVMVLQAVVYAVHGEGETAVQFLTEALTLAEPNGFIRLFIDEGAPMAKLLARMNDEIRPQVGGRMNTYIQKLSAAFGNQAAIHPSSFKIHPLIKPLSARELEVLQLIAQGLSNREIGERLFLALNTVKGHNRRIFNKLDVQRRTEAIARARELGLL